MSETQRSTPPKHADDPSPLVSIVICTHNRAEYLAKAIKSAIEQDTPKSHYEIVVVDNASNDSTPSVVAGFSHASNLRYLHEAKLGVSFARNTGWREAKGKYVAYLDDDAIAPPNWVEEVAAAFEEYPEVGAVGGRVDPIWVAKRPKWLADELVVSLGVIDWSNTPKLIEDLRFEWLVTANMAVPRSVLEVIGGFETRLGRVGKTQARGEDTFFQKQLLQSGYTCLYYPTMKVGHHVVPSRLKRKWFRNRYFTQGIADALTQLVEEELTEAERKSHAFNKARAIIRSPKTILNLILPSFGSDRFAKKCLTLIALGHVRGLLAAKPQ